MMKARHGIVFCICLLTSSTIMAASPPAQADASSTTPAAATGNKALQPPRCNSLDANYFRALPGVVGNCYATRKWRKGHYDAAIDDFKNAASWGSKSAQYSLGLIYYTGRHVTPDKALGLAWLELATERHQDPHKEMVARSAKKLATPEQEKRARNLFAQLSTRYADKVAANRAWKHYKHWKTYRKMAKMAPMMPECANLPPVADPKMMQQNMRSEIRCRYEEANDRMLKEHEDDLVGRYFQGWVGTVKVEELQETPAPTPSGD